MKWIWIDLPSSPSKEDCWKQYFCTGSIVFFYIFTCLYVILFELLVASMYSSLSFFLFINLRLPSSFMVSSVSWERCSYKCTFLKFVPLNSSLLHLIRCSKIIIDLQNDKWPWLWSRGSYSCSISQNLRLTLVLVNVFISLLPSHVDLSF